LYSQVLGTTTVEVHIAALLVVVQEVVIVVEGLEGPGGLFVVD
jgi:hypothetical protein